MLFGVGGGISAFIVSKLFKIDFHEGYAVSISCLVGYPPTQKITEETLQAAAPTPTWIRRHPTASRPTMSRRS